MRAVPTYNPRSTVVQGHIEVLRRKPVAGEGAEHRGGHETVQLPYPPTIVVTHPKENRKKCTLAPLRGRADIHFVRYRPGLSLNIDPRSYVRLAVEGPPLSRADASRGLLLLDGTWRYARQMEKDFVHIEPRSLRGFQTAYPRVSRLFEDPVGGLASVEALYLAYRILGRPTRGLLAAYRWADEFLRLNDVDDPEATREPTR